MAFFHVAILIDYLKKPFHHLKVERTILKLLKLRATLSLLVLFVIANECLGSNQVLIGPGV